MMRDETDNEYSDNDCRSSLKQEEKQENVMMKCLRWKIQL